MVTSNPFSAMFGRSPFHPLLAHIVKANECADELLPFFEASLEELKDLLDSGFGRNVSDVMQKLIRELHVLEQQADGQQVAIRRQLFELEDRLPPVDEMFFYKIIDPELLQEDPQLLVYGMLAAATWLLVASIKGIFG